MKERVFFKTKLGLKLCGVLSNPSGRTDSPIVIMCHGFSTNKDGRTNTRLEETFNDSGIATLRFDFFGHGESEGRFEDVTISEAVVDVLTALEFLKSRGFSKTGLVGSSFGGLASLLAASQTPEFYVLGLKSPVSHYLGLLAAREGKIDITSWRDAGYIWVTGADGRKLRLSFSFYKDAERIQGYETVKRITTPALIVHGDRDEIVPLEQSKITASLMPDCRLEVVRGADHIYSQPKHFEQMITLLSQFVLRLTFPGITP